MPSEMPTIASTPMTTHASTPRRSVLAAIIPLWWVGTARRVRKLLGGETQPAVTGTIAPYAAVTRIGMWSDEPRVRVSTSSTVNPCEVTKSK